MRYLIVDLEATCWAKKKRDHKFETIEIGAVLLSSAGGPISGEFNAFVRPVVFPELSDYCTQLTSIRQCDVERADTFPSVFLRFVEWIGAEPYRFCSWGSFDQRQLEADCLRHNISLPMPFRAPQHINMKRVFTTWKSGKQLGMAAALHLMNIPLEGTHHRGIDDARNLAKIAQQMLPFTHPEVAETRLEFPSAAPHNKNGNPQKIEA